MLLETFVFLTILLDTFVFSSLLMKITKCGAFSSFPASSITNASLYLSFQDKLFSSTLFWHTLKYMLLYFCHGFNLLFRIHFPGWGSIEKNYKISRNHHEWIYEIMVRYMLLLNLTHWDSVKTSTQTCASLISPTLLWTSIAIFNAFSSYTWLHIIVFLYAWLHVYSCCFKHLGRARGKRQ